MGLFDRLKKKKQDSDKTPEIEATKARVEAINGGKFNADEAYEKSIAYFAEEEAKQARRIKEAENINNEVMGRISQLNNAPGARRANKVAHEMAVELEKELKKRETAEEYLEKKLEKLKQAGYPKIIIDKQRENFITILKEDRTKGYSENSFKSLVDKCFGWVDDLKTVEQSKPAWETEECLENYLIRLKKMGFPNEKIENIRKTQLELIKDARQKGLSEKDIKNIYVDNNIGLYVDNVPLIAQEIQDTLEGIETPEELIEIYLAKLQEQGVSKKIIQKIRENYLNSLWLGRQNGSKGIIKNSYLKSEIRQQFSKFSDPQIYMTSPEDYLEKCLANLQEQGISNEKIEIYRQKILEYIDTIRRIMPERDDYVLNESIILSLKGYVNMDNQNKEQIEQQMEEETMAPRKGSR